MSEGRGTVFPAYPQADYRHHEAGIDAALRRVLHGGGYILGPEVAAFETEFAALMGCQEAVGVANGTDSIELLLRASDLPAGAGVAVPSQTAVASVSAVQRAGLVPVFVDIDPASFTMSAKSLEAVLAAPSTNVQAVLAVHLYGHPCAMAEILAVVRAANRPIRVFEDCAQAHGATYCGRPVGSLADGASFSFYPTKNLGAIGDGGAVTTSDAVLADRIRSLRQYGWRERYISAESGINSRLDELQAAILRVKLATFSEMMARRRHLAGLYAQQLGDCAEIQLPAVAEHCAHGWHLFVIRASRRDELMRHLNGRGIPAALHYPAAVHQQPAYREIAAKGQPLPETERAVQEILSLPLHPHLPEESVCRVAAEIAGFYRAHRS